MDNSFWRSVKWVDMRYTYAGYVFVYGWDRGLMAIHQRPILEELADGRSVRGGPIVAVWIIKQKRF